MKRALRAGVQSIVRRFGYEFRRTDAPFRATDDYVTRYEPRWGYDKPPHEAIRQRLAVNTADYAATLRAFLAYRDIFHGLTREGDPANPSRPYWRNSYFSVLDAVSLMGFLLHGKPRLYLEIGCGHSTRFARHAISAGRLDTKIVSVDPEPRVDVDTLCDRVIRSRLEDCDVTLFDDLRSGDVLFFDGTHRILQNSDVTVFFLEILPRLKPGVLVHVHDIFWPEDYPQRWVERFYSEQYVLGTMLLSNAPMFRVVLPNRFVYQDPALFKLVHDLFRGVNGHEGIPFEYPSGLPAASFWLESGTQTPGA